MTARVEPDARPGTPTATAGPVLELADVRVVHDGRAALDVPALAVRAREVLAVIGPNGAGKSTLLRVLGLLQAPTGGAVRFHGRAVEPGGALGTRRRMASVFQEPLLADTTVRDNVAMGLAFRRTPRADAERRVAAWLERFGIAGLARRQARTLSGGEAQRAALARALVLEPEVLLLDEPFSALDQPTREALIADLAPILRQAHVATVLVTHDRGEAMALADRIAVLLGGRLVQIGATAEVFRAPVSEEVARFVGVETILDGRVVSADRGVAVLSCAGHAIEVAAAALPGERVRVCLRPEDVTVALGAAPPSSARNRLAGRVVRLAASGAHLRLTIDCGVMVEALVTHRSAEEMGLAPGLAVTALFKATAPHLLRPPVS
jgi:tungstate transport system ATP-binding protein